MMEVEKITNKIKEEAEREAKKIIEEAKKKAKEIIKKAEDEAENRSNEIVSHGENDAELERQRILANAKLQARKIKLDIKERIIEKAFSIAEDKIKDIVSSDNYENILRDLIKEAVSTITKENLEVLCRKKDKTIVRKIIKDFPGLKLSDENIDTMGGVIVRSQDKQVQVDNTFEARLMRMRDDLRIEVAKILFGGRDKP